jgi:hypothetical protein
MELGRSWLLLAFWMLSLDGIHEITTRSREAANREKQRACTEATELKTMQVEDDHSMDIKTGRRDPGEEKEKTRRLDELDETSFHSYQYRGYKIMIEAA